MSRFNPTDIEVAVLAAFRLRGDSGLVGMLCSRCGATWDDLNYDEPSWKDLDLIKPIQKAWDHFLGGCK